MGAQLVAVVFDANDPARLAQFWSGVLGRDVVGAADGAVLPGDHTQLGLRFALSRAQRTGPNRMHPHLTSDSPTAQQQTVAIALRLGARHLDVGQRPEEEHVVLADPEGNEFCVIPPGNAFLAGCGFLGELACDGSRQVGHFWSEALGWPLVWDQDEETAIQSPYGGTKVAWGGPPVPSKRTRNRQHFELTPTDPYQEGEVERLVLLGASLLEVLPDGRIELADPDGNEFRMVSPQ